MMMSLFACKPAEDTSKHVDGSLQEIIDQIYEGAGVESPMHAETPLNNDNVVYNIGTSDVKYTEGLASDALIMTNPHSIVVLRAEKGSDIEAAKQLIRDNIDPRKWICVGVDPENVIVDSIGDLIFVVMSVDSAAYHNSFLSLGK